MPRKPLIKLLLALGLYLLSLHSFAAAVNDVRILVDVSGSMVKSDPDNLRKPAVRMLSSLIPTGSMAGMWTFGRYTNMETKWGQVNDAWRRAAEKGANVIHSRGQFTNIDGALQRASRGWEKQEEDVLRSMILLTDGEVDVAKDTAKNQASRLNLVNKTLPGLVSKGVKIHTIALSRNADASLLRRIALDSGGSFEIADSADQLQRIFLRIFERVAQPDTVPLQDNSFKVDGSIKEMTLLIFRRSEQQTRLIDPGGTSYTSNQGSKQVTWKSDQGYDLITVQNPRAGTWKIDADVDPDNRVMVVTDLKLEVQNLPYYMTPDQEINVHTELHSQGKKISKNSFLKFVKFSRTHHDGDKATEKPLRLQKYTSVADKGIFIDTIKAPLNEGMHRLEIVANGSTFSRSKTFEFNVQWPVDVNIRAARQPGRFLLTVTPRPEYVQPQSLKIDAELSDPAGSRQALQLQKAKNVWEADVNANRADGMHQLFLTVAGSGNKGAAFEHQMGPYPLLGTADPTLAPPVVAVVSESTETANIEEQQIETEAAEEDNFWFNLIIIAIANVVLILGGLGVYWYLRKKNQADEFDLSADSDLVVEVGND